MAPGVDSALPTKYVRITDICIASDSFKPSRSLDVRLDRERKAVRFVGDTASKSFRWTFEDKVDLWPKSSLAVQLYRHRTLNKFYQREKAILVEITAEDLVKACTKKPGEKDEWTSNQDSFTITIGMSLQVFTSPRARDRRQNTVSALADPTPAAPVAEVIQDINTLSDILGDFSWVLNYLQGFTQFVEGIAAVHPAAVAAVQILSVVCKMLVNEKNFNADLRNLGVEIRDLLSYLAQVDSRAKIEVLRDTVVSIMKAITEAAEFTTDYLRKDALGKLWAAQFRQARLSRFKDLFARLRRNLLEGVNLQVLVDVYQIAESTEWVEEEVVLINRLKPVSSGGYAECMDGTRKGILQEIYSWMDDMDAPNILWVSGSPGAGKTAIAATVVKTLLDRQRLGARFFFKQGDASLGDPTSVWRSIAYDLAKSHPGVRRSVVEVLKSGKVDSSWGDVESIFTTLIAAPLNDNHEHYFGQFPVVVLDALDECDSSQAQKWTALLNTFKQWSNLSRSFKLLITSRPEDRIARSFSDIHRHIDLLTGSDTSAETANDIRFFIRKRVADITERYSDTLSPNWARPEQIEKFAKHAAGLFIWVETAMKYIEEGSDPEAQLEHVVAGELGAEGGNVYRLYSKILEASFKTESDLAAFRVIVGTILLVKIPLSRIDLRNLVPREIKAVSLDIILAKLRSVITVGENDRLQISHQSFADYLLNHDRCPKAFTVDQAEQSCSLALSCLQTMNNKDGLKFNICKLETSHLFNRDIPDLAQRIIDNIPASLSYSCRYWARHLLDARSLSPDDNKIAVLLKNIKELLYNRVLYWLEVMSLVGEVTGVPAILLAASRWAVSFDRDLAAFAEEASRFAVTFRDAISDSAPHIYISALPFTPSESMISKRYLSRFPRTISVPTGRETGWPVILHVFRGHTDCIFSVAYSRDGKRVASGSEDNKVRVWDAETGTSVAGTFEGHTLSIISVAYSRDGKRIASGSADQTVRVWDAATGNIVAGPFRGHTDKIFSVAFSPDGKRIVSGSLDKTVCIWDIKIGNIATGPCKGHTDFVNAVAFSPDGSRVVSGSSDKTVRIWDAETGKCVVGPLEGHTGKIYGVAFSPDGTNVVSGAGDKTLRVWNAETGSNIMVLEGHGGTVFALAYSFDGKRLVSGAADKKVRIWDATSGEPVGKPFEGHTEYIYSVAFSPDGKHVASCAHDKTIRIWDATTGEGVASVLKGHTGTVYSIAYSPDGKNVASGSEDTTVRLWDAKTGERLASPFEGHTESIITVAYSPDNTRVASGSADETIRIWDTDTGSCVAGPFKGHTDKVFSVAFSPDGTRIVSGALDNTLRIWDAQTGDSIVGPLKGHTESVYSVAYAPDGTRVISGGSDKTVRVWDAETGSAVGSPFEGHTDKVYAVAFSPDNRHIASGSKDFTVCIWDTVKGKIAGAPFKGHTGTIFSVAFSPDGRRVVSGSGDCTVRIWDTETGDAVAGPFEGHSEYIYSVAFSPDGRRVISGSLDKKIYVWDAEVSGNVSSDSEDSTSTIFCVMYSPDGKRIVTGSADGMVRVWDAETGTSATSPFAGHTASVISAAYSPDGKRIVSGSGDKTIRVWDAETGRCVAGPFKKHTSKVFSVAFSPDGKRVVSGALDNTLCVWDAETGNIIAGPLEGHTDYVNSVAFSPDGKHVISGSNDKTIRIWDAETGDRVGDALEGHTDKIFSVAYSPDGTRIVSGARDHMVRMWDAKTGKSVKDPIKGHTSTVFSVAFSRDGEHVVSGAGDAMVRVWDAEASDSGAGPIAGHMKSIYGVAFSPDGKRIASVSEDRIIRISDVEQATSSDAQTSPVRSVAFTYKGTQVVPIDSLDASAGEEPSQSFEAQVDFSSEDKVGSLKHLALESSGWIRGSDSEVLLWILPNIRRRLWRPQNTLFIGAPATVLDLSTFVHGSSWTQCRS